MEPQNKPSYCTAGLEFDAGIVWAGEKHGLAVCNSAIKATNPRFTKHETFGFAKPLWRKIVRRSTQSSGWLSRGNSVRRGDR